MQTLLSPGRRAALSPLKPASGRTRAFRFAIGVALVIGACGCGTAQIASRHEVTQAPETKPTTIYVSDFELDAASIRSEEGLLPPPPKPPAPFGSLLPAPPGTSKNPEALARDLVDSMSEALVRDLTRAGLRARRQARGALPTNGWLV